MGPTLATIVRPVRLAGQCIIVQFFEFSLEAGQDAKTEQIEK